MKSTQKFFYIDKIRIGCQDKILYSPSYKNQPKIEQITEQRSKKYENQGNTTSLKDCDFLTYKQIPKNVK